MGHLLTWTNIKYPDSLLGDHHTTLKFFHRNIWIYLRFFCPFQRKFYVICLQIMYFLCCLSCTSYFIVGNQHLKSNELVFYFRLMIYLLIFDTMMKLDWQIDNVWSASRWLEAAHSTEWAMFWPKATVLRPVRPTRPNTQSPPSNSLIFSRVWMIKVFRTIASSNRCHVGINMTALFA